MKMLGEQVHGYEGFEGNVTVTEITHSPSREELQRRCHGGGGRIGSWARFIIKFIFYAEPTLEVAVHCLVITAPSRR